MSWIRWLGDRLLGLAVSCVRVAGFAIFMLGLALGFLGACLVGLTEPDP